MSHQKPGSGAIRHRRRRGLGVLLGAAALGLLAASPVAAADPPDKPPEKAADKKPAGAKAEDAGRPMTFGDEDLEKYHKPKPRPAPETEAIPTPPAVPAAGPAAAASARPPAPPAGVAAPAARPPAPRPASPAYAPSRPARVNAPPEDPLKPWKDREAKAAFRQEQLRGLREKIDALQGRLDYLNQKRLAIVDPLRVMPKPQTGDDRTADAAKGPRDLLAGVDEEITRVQDDLKQAKDDLILVETRFQEESQKP